MPANPSKFNQFWQELKRRKVVRVITVYAAAAFVILELVSIIAEPLKLPDWTLAMVIVLLCIGFIIAIILSWIYDVTPQSIERTKSVKEAKEEAREKPSSLMAWKIATYLSAIVIVVLAVLHFVNRNEQSKDILELDKSIAVLPFRNDSPDVENEYFINGTMESILDNLCKIEDLRVIART
jgi:adenylate cyclase